MFNLKRKFVALVMAVALGSALSVDTFGQKGDRDRPPKPDNKVVVKEKDPPPRPPQNNNQPPPKNDDKRGKPLN